MKISSVWLPWWSYLPCFVQHRYCSQGLLLTMIIPRLYTTDIGRNSTDFFIGRNSISASLTSVEVPSGIMAPWCPLRNLSRRSTSDTSLSAKRSIPSTSSNGRNKRRAHILPAPVSSSRTNHSRTPSGTPVSIHPCVRTIGELEEPDIQDEFDDSLDHVVLAINKNCKKTVGCSYYVARHGVLYVMEDIENAGDDTVHSCEFYYLST